MRRPGFTLPEFLIYIAIVAALLLAATDILLMVLRENAKWQAIAEVNDHTRIALDRMTLAVRNADSITSPLPSATSGQLLLAMADASINPTIFTLGDGAVQMKEGAAATTTITSNGVVINLTFQNLTPTGTQGTIGAAIGVRAVASGMQAEYQFIQTVSTTASIQRRP